MMGKTIVITDLDGTLLDRDYSFEAARPAIEFLRERAVPVIVCSSKTRPEIELYRGRLGLKDPFIVENGGGVFIPKGYFGFVSGGEQRDGYETLSFGARYEELRRALQRIREKTGIRVAGFGDMSPGEVAELSGFSVSEARLAKEREFDEPFVFEKGEVRIEEFLRSIEEEGLRWTRGVFYHILGDNDKGKAAIALKGLFERAFGTVTTIALGDSLNDLPLLLQADYPVLVRKKDGGYETGIDLPRLIRASGVGPEGWREAVLGLGAIL